MKKNKIEKSVSIKLATNPGQLVLLGIVIFNVLLFFVTAIILMHLNIPGTEKMSFFESSFYAIRIIMTGDMDFVINEIGGAGAAASFCARTSCSPSLKERILPPWAASTVIVRSRTDTAYRSSSSFWTVWAERAVAARRAATARRVCCFISYYFP